MQTRVIDGVGNMGAVKSQAIALDTVAPAAPTSVVINGSQVTVTFDRANVKAGDRINLINGDKRFDYVLTATDLNAGVAVISPGINFSGGVIARILDLSGNLSDEKSYAVTKTDFSDFSLPMWSEIPLNKEFITKGFAVKVAAGSVVLAAEGSGMGFSGNWLHLYAGSVTEFTLPSLATSINFAYEGVDHPAGNVINFYDRDGVLIKSMNPL